jgi:phosphatidylglycerol lysyltransferase
MISPAEAPVLMPTLKAISDAWLEGKKTREKGFSLGFFREDYIGSLPCALVIKNEKPVAFASVLLGGDKKELTVDLMRFAKDAPKGAMDYLFIQLMLWGKAEGYEYFSLGMAPLSGMSSHVLAPYWNKLGAFLFRHGEHFYNFQGLRTYKEKFKPVWEPRYLASPGGLALPAILFDVATVISGGVKGVIFK